MCIILWASVLKALSLLPALLCYLKHVNVLMALFETLLLLIPVWSIKMLISKYLLLGSTWFWDNFFLLHLKLRDDSECLFWICTFDTVSLAYSASCRCDLFCDLSIVLLRHSHGNLSGLPKSKSWWSAISFGNLTTLLSLCLLL